MPEKYLYVFVRQDIPVPQQIVQSNHAVFSLVTLLQLQFSVPNIIVIGVPDVKALERVQLKLKSNSIKHYAWTEPDFDFGFTSIATVPLSVEEKSVLSGYRLLKFADTQDERAPLAA